MYNTALHQEKSKNVFSSNLCGDTCDEKDNLKHHRNKKHHHKENHECPTFQQIFTENQKLEDHILKAHNEMKKISCEKCGMSLIFEWKMKMHKILHDNETANRKCHFFNN